MATVKSVLRSVLKPILFRLLSEDAYLWFQYRAKIRDIDQHLVDEDEIEVLPLFLADDSVVFDIGANYGYYTVPLARLCPKGSVYAFEPIPSTFQVLSRIVKHYGLNNVRLCEYGVGAEDAVVEFQAPVQESGFVSAGQAHIARRHDDLPAKGIYYPWETNRVYQCRVVSIDKAFPSLQRLDLVKIDIEGAELFALEGMAKTLETCRPVVLIEICKFWLTGFGYDVSDLAGFIGRLNYGIYHYDRAARRLNAVPTLADDARYNYIDPAGVTPFAPNYVLVPSEWPVDPDLGEIGPRRGSTGYAVQ